MRGAMQLLLNTCLLLVVYTTQLHQVEACVYSTTSSQLYSFNCGPRKCSYYRTVTSYRGCVDGGWSAFTSWVDDEPCSESCGGGEKNQTRTRTCTSPPPYPAGIGPDCSGDDAENRTIACNIHACPIDGGWSEWDVWVDTGNCSVTCGNGTLQQGRERTCTDPTPLYGGQTCTGRATEEQHVPCNTHECPVNGGWSPWSNWTHEEDCPVTCGGASVVKVRSRSCDSPAPAHGGNDCNGSDTGSRNGTCGNNPCPVDGGWSEWSNWTIGVSGNCSSSCGGGRVMETQTRTCTSPAQAHGGDDCTGDADNSREVDCNTNPCPVDGGWSEWSNWGPRGDITVVGDRGTWSVNRTRVCDSPAPAHGGQMCGGPSSESRQVTCHISKCQDICTGDYSVRYAHPSAHDAYYRCTSSDNMELATCDQYYNTDKQQCDNYCRGNEFLRKPHPARCDYSVLCVGYIIYLELPCSPFDSDNYCKKCTNVFK